MCVDLCYCIFQLFGYYMLLLSEVLTLSIYFSPDLDEHLCNHYLEHFFFFDTTLISVLSSSFSDVLSCYHNITNSSVSLRVLILCALLFIRFGSFHFPVLEKWPYPGDAWRAQQHTPGPALQAPGGDPSVGCVAGPAIGDQLVGGVGP